MKLFLALFFAIVTLFDANAQQRDTAFLSVAISNAIQNYNSRMTGEWPLNSGGQFVEYVSLNGEHPFFIPTWSNGSVQYLDDVYNNVPLLLDLRSDRLITLHSTFKMKIHLSAEKVKKFSLANHRFVHLRIDSIEMLPESGYYEILQTGKASLVARHKKSIKRGISSGKDVAILKESHNYYLIIDDMATAVKSKKSLFKAFKDRPDIKSQARRNKLKFGPGREATLSGIVRIYNELHEQ